MDDKRFPAFWLDLYLSGSREGFALPTPFVAGSLPEKPYTKDELQAYLDYGRKKCQATKPLNGAADLAGATLARDPVR